jgi:hypothetical protein
MRHPTRSVRRALLILVAAALPLALALAAFAFLHGPAARTRGQAPAAPASPPVVAVAQTPQPSPATAAPRTSRRAPERHRATAPAAPALTAAAGMVVAIDPETGALTLPTPEQMLALTPQERTGLLRTTAGLQAVRLPDGTVMLDLQGRFMEFAVVQLDAQGRPYFRCLDDPAALRRALLECAPAPAPAAEEK